MQHGHLDPRQLNTRILVVDDNESIHEDIKKLLSPSKRNHTLDALTAQLFGQVEERSSVVEEFEISCALQGEQAVEMVRKAKSNGAPFAMAFVDMRMPPGWDGTTTIKHLWATDARLEVVICSAYSDSDWHEATKELRQKDQLLFLKKPFDGREVVQLAQNLTKKWSIRRELEYSLTHLESMLHQHADTMLKLNERVSSLLREKQVQVRSVEETLHPAPDPVRIGALELAGSSHMCDELGGDWWAYQTLADDRLLVVMGAVSGHGIPSALFAAAARGAIRAMRRHCPEVTPAEVLITLDEVVRDVSRGRGRMSAIAAIFGAQRGVVEVADAGHPMPILLHLDAEQRGAMPLSIQGEPLGGPGISIHEEKQTLAPGDLHMFLSSGLAGRLAASGHGLAATQAFSVLKSSSSEVRAKGVAFLRDTLQEAIMRLNRQAPADDDMSLVICHYRPDGGQIPLRAT